jgi:hypothetical protein
MMMARKKPRNIRVTLRLMNFVAGIGWLFIVDKETGNGQARHAASRNPPLNALDRRHFYHELVWRGP